MTLAFTGTDGRPHNGHALPNRVDEGTQPPQNIGAELGVLRAMIEDGGCIDEVATILRPEDFYREAHQAIARAIFAMHGGGEDVDTITLAEELTRQGVFKAIGGDATLARIMEDAAGGGVKFHAQIVKQKAIARRLIQVSDRLRRDAYSNNFTADDLLADAERSLFEIADSAATGKDYVFLADTADAAVERILARQEGHTTGVRSGWDELDLVTGGFQPGSLNYIAARTSMGKTALALNMIDHMAHDAGLPVFIFSLEMDRPELEDRLFATRARIEGDRIKGLATLDGHDAANLYRAKAAFKAGRNFAIDDHPHRTMTQIAAIARRARAREKIGCFFVDQIQLIESENKHESRQLQIAATSRRLKILARELGTPFVVMSQLNRKPEDRDGHRPRLSDLRESGDQEQDADLVLLIHRDDYYDTKNNPGKASVIVAKNRNGQRKDVDMGFIHKYMKFVPFGELARHHGGETF